MGQGQHFQDRSPSGAAVPASAKAAISPGTTIAREAVYHALPLNGLLALHLPFSQPDSGSPESQIHAPLKGVRCYNDAQADMPLAEAAGAICVQRFDDSRNSAIHTTYRISLRSSSLREPRYPLLRVVFSLFLIRGAAPEGASPRICL
jgi:hypothetical protein